MQNTSNYISECSWAGINCSESGRITKSWINKSESRQAGRHARVLKEIRGSGVSVCRQAARVRHDDTRPDGYQLVLSWWGHCDVKKLWQTNSGEHRKKLFSCLRAVVGLNAWLESLADLMRCWSADNQILWIHKNITQTHQGLYWEWIKGPVQMGRQ